VWGEVLSDGGTPFQFRNSFYSKFVSLIWIQQQVDTCGQIGEGNTFGESMNSMIAGDRSALEDGRFNAVSESTAQASCIANPIH